MDAGDSNEVGSEVRRRSTRRLSQTVLVYSADPRKPLERKRKANKSNAPTQVINGTKNDKSLADEEDEANTEPPAKSQKLQKEVEKAGDRNIRGDGDQTDVEMDDNADHDEDMNSEDEVEDDCALPKCFSVDSTVQSRIDVKLSASEQKENAKPEIILSHRKSIHDPVDPIPSKLRTDQNNLRTTFKDTSSLSSVPVQPKPIENLERLSRRHKTNYQDNTKDKIKDISRVTHIYRQAAPDRIPTARLTGLQNNFLRQAPHHKTTEVKNLKSLKKPASTTRGCTWYVRKLLLSSLILIVLSVSGFVGYQKCSQTYMPSTDVVQLKKQEKFNADMTALQLRYPNQHSELWKRTIIHLQRHLKTLNPTEPVSLILTSGLNAEKTLACLARSLAETYSSSLNNGSIFEIDGTTKKSQDSDQVKLDIDTALRKAFDGNQSAAVVHRFEELPPGSTLIFYRYCDHENAAYKKVFLAFTVMLSVDKIDTNTSLSVIEDMVHERIQQKFVSSDKSAMFNQMDVDKLSGLWSRISHLILPVTAVEKTEEQGCES